MRNRRRHFGGVGRRIDHCRADHLADAGVPRDVGPSLESGAKGNDWQPNLQLHNASQLGHSHEDHAIEDIPGGTRRSHAMGSNCRCNGTIESLCGTWLDSINDVQWAWLKMQLIYVTRPIFIANRWNQLHRSECSRRCSSIKICIIRIILPIYLVYPWPERCPFVEEWASSRFQCLGKSAMEWFIASARSLLEIVSEWPWKRHRKCEDQRTRAQARKTIWLICLAQLIR